MPFALRNREHRTNAKSINHRLTAAASLHNDHTINFTPQAFQMSRHDEIHLGKLAHSMVINRFKAAITHGWSAVNI